MPRRLVVVCSRLRFDPPVVSLSLEDLRYVQRVVPAAVTFLEPPGSRVAHRASSAGLAISRRASDSTLS